jgi:hypothetical protein
MKRENLGWFVAAMVVLAAAVMGAAPGASDVGRWQIVSSRQTFYDESNPKETVGKEKPITFLLDTKTGDARPLVNSSGLTKEKVGPYFWGFVMPTFEQTMAALRDNK